MRTYLQTFAVVLSIAGLLAGSATIAAAGSSGSSAGAAGSSSSAAGGGHGGGGGAHGGGGGPGGGGSGGGRLDSSYAAHGGYVAHGVNGARGGYGIVGSKSAGLDHGGAVGRAGHVARNPLIIGPRRGNAAAATRVTDRRLRPDRLRRRPTCPQTGAAGPCFDSREIPATFCPPATDEVDYPVAGCPQPIKTSGVRPLPGR